VVDGMSGFGFNLFGGKRTKKQRRRDQCNENRERGLQKQRMDELTYRMQGYEVTRRKTGCDFEATRTNLWTGRKAHVYVESKSSSTAPMRPLQKKMQKKKKGHYRVERGNGLFFIGGFMPAPKVKKGKWSKERERNQDGTWRQKRSDAGKKRKTSKKNIWDLYPSSIYTAIQLSPKLIA
jgi:hypothetical protein